MAEALRSVFCSAYGICDRPLRWWVTAETDQRNDHAMIDWQRYIRRYVWDDQATPYTRRVEALSREQAHSELFFYSVLLATCFLVLTVISLAGKLPFGPSAVAGVYCVTIVAAAAVLAVTKVVVSAVWITTAPLAVIGTVAIFGFPKQMAMFDQLLLLAVMVGLLRYSLRLVRIARAYPTLPSRPPEDKPRRKLF